MSDNAWYCLTVIIVAIGFFGYHIIDEYFYTRRNSPPITKNYYYECKHSQNYPMWNWTEETTHTPVKRKAKKRNG